MYKFHNAIVSHVKPCTARIECNRKRSLRNTRQTRLSISFPLECLLFGFVLAETTNTVKITNVLNRDKIFLETIL